MNELTKPTFDLDVYVNIPEVEKVEHNLDKLEIYANEINNFYNNLVIKESDIKFAEAEKTKINGLIKQVDRLRIDKVKEYKQPIDDFETTAKNTVSILKDAVNNITNKLNFYTEQANNEKFKKVIEPMINAALSQAFNKGVFIKPENIVQDKRWFNKTIKESEVEKDIQDQVDSIITDELRKREDIEIIKNTIKVSGKNINEEKYIERYKYTRELSSILTDINAELNKAKEVQMNIDIFNTTQTIYETTISFRGNVEQINQIREYAKQIGMKEV